MIRIEEREEELHLNMAPMIDMVFLLIIFFLTATTFTSKEREQDVLLPSAAGTSGLSRSVQSKLVVNVLESGEVRVSGKTLGQAELLDVVRQRKARARHPLKVMVRADKRTAYGNVATTLATIERAGVQRPFVITQLVEMES